MEKTSNSDYYSGTRWEKDHKDHYRWEANRYGVRHVVGYNPRYILRVALICLSVLGAMIAVDIPFVALFKTCLLGLTTTGAAFFVAIMLVVGVNISGCCIAAARYYCNIQMYNSNIWEVN